jgi:hypothetical protein
MNINYYYIIKGEPDVWYFESGDVLLKDNVEWKRYYLVLISESSDRIIIHCDNNQVFAEAPPTSHDLLLIRLKGVQSR